MASWDLQVELLKPGALDVLQEMVLVVRSVARSYFSNASVVMQWKVSNARKRLATLTSFSDGLCRDFPFLSKPSDASMKEWSSSPSSKTVGVQVAERFVRELVTTDPDNLSPGALRLKMLERVVSRLRSLALRRLQDSRRMPVTLACLETFFARNPDEDAWNEFASQWTDVWGLDGADLLGCYEAWSIRPSILEDLYHRPKPESLGSVCTSFVRDASASPSVDLVAASAAVAAAAATSDRSIVVGPCVTADGALCWGSRSSELGTGGGLIAWVDASTRTFLRARTTGFGQTLLLELWKHVTMETWWSVQIASATFDFLDTVDAGSGRVLVVYGTRSAYTGECHDSQFVVLRRIADKYELDDESADAMTNERFTALLDSPWSAGFAIQTQLESEPRRGSGDDAPLLRHIVSWKLVDGQGDIVCRGRTDWEDRPVALSTAWRNGRSVPVVWLGTDKSRPGVVIDPERAVADGTVRSPRCVVQHALMLREE